MVNENALGMKRCILVVTFCLALDVRAAVCYNEETAFFCHANESSSPQNGREETYERF